MHGVIHFTYYVISNKYVHTNTITVCVFKAFYCVYAELINTMVAKYIVIYVVSFIKLLAIASTTYIYSVHM